MTRAASWHGRSRLLAPLVLAALVGVPGCGDDDEPTAPQPEVADVPDTAEPPPDTGPAEDVPPTPQGPLAEAGWPLAVDEATGTYTLGALTGFGGAGAAAYAGPFASRHSVEDVLFLLGYYAFVEEGDPWTAASVAGGPPEAGEGGALTIDGEVTVEVEAVGDGTVALTISAPVGANRTSAAFTCPADERFLGFGAQTSTLEFRGERVPIWVGEQGIGKNDLLRESEIPLGFAGRKHDSYFPVPFFLSPRGYGVLVEGTERIVFELCSEQSDAWRVEIWSDQLRLILFHGDTPLQVLERATAWWGRPPTPPDWAWLPWIAVKGGTEHVREKAEALRDAAIPAAAIWAEDWLGESINAITGNNLKYHWVWDEEHYPDLPGLIDELHGMDLKFLGYFNPFIVTQFDEWPVATEKDWIPQTPEGEDYKFLVLAQEGSVVDVTSPDARQWLLEHMQTGRELGLDGWMADYAEWVPYDAVFADGRTGAEVSSEYPLLWQEVNRQACPPDDCVFFVRSGFTGSGGIVTAAWGGDQNTDFGEDDGLPTAVRIGVGLGLAGVAFYGSDIAGYTSSVNPPSTKELYFRWTELGAFSPIMRTHEGNRGEENWNYDEDAETLAHFKRYAERHTRLYPFFRALMRVAHERGLPIIRHPALHWPESADMLAVRDTYLLGDSLYVAPVVAEGATTREVVLPPGRWAQWDSGARREGTVQADAPLTEIPVYAREGAVVPLLHDATVQGPAAAQAAHESHLDLVVVTGGDGELTLADGAQVSLTSTSPSDPGALGLPDCAGDARGCTEVVEGQRRYRLEGAQLGSAADGFAVTITGGPATRLYDVRVLAP